MSKKQQTQLKQKSGKQKRPSPTPIAIAAPRAMIHHTAFPYLPFHQTAWSLRQTAILQMQQQHGNGHTQQIIQRKQGDQPSTLVPGLSQRHYDEANRNLANNPQMAVDAVVQGLVAHNKMNLSYLQNNTVQYISDTSRFPPNHYGLTSLTPGSGRPRPCRVEVGPAALGSVSLLYTTLIHEYEHVLQFRAGHTAAGEAQGEVESRFVEIENLHESGLWRESSYMGRIAGQLDHWWQQLAEEEQRPLQERYQQAQATLRQMIQRLQDEQFRQQMGR